MKELARRIEAAAGPLAATTFEAMYRNPFWNERFGERGRKFAAQDGLHHISYLVQALLAEDAAILENYARWLQSVLTSRGICTRHLAENFQRLSAAIARENFPRGEEAVRYLALAEAALEYASGSPRELQRASTRIAQRAAASMYERHPEWEQKYGAPGRDRCVEDGLYHLSYLADSLALGRPDSFSSYCPWMASFLERLGMSRHHLEEMLAAIGDGLKTDAALSAELTASAIATLEAGRNAISGSVLPAHLHAAPR